MKTTELFVEQTLTGFLVLTAGAAPFLSWENLQKLPHEAKGRHRHFVGRGGDRRSLPSRRQILERSARRLPKTYDLHTDEDCQDARARMKATREPVVWLGVILLALGLGLIPLGTGPARPAMAAGLATGAVLTAISAWAWWRTTETFMQFLRDFRKWAREK